MAVEDGPARQADDADLRALLFQLLRGLEDDADLTAGRDKREVLALDLVHERGVLHNDIELRHMLINGNHGVVLIDFQLSKALHPKPEVHVKACTEAEIRAEKRQIAASFIVCACEW